MISRSAMQNTQRLPFSSGHPPQHAFIRQTLISSGVPPSRQSRFTQPNSNDLPPQTRMSSAGYPNVNHQQSAITP